MTTDSKPKLEGLGIQTVVWRAKPRNARQIDEVRWEFQRRRAGRFRLLEIINFLSKNTETKREWWADALVEAIDLKRIPLRNPCNFSDAKPYIAPGKPVPRILRAYYDCVDLDDVNRWLDAHPEWRETWRFPIAPKQRAGNGETARAPNDPARGDGSIRFEGPAGDATSGVTVIAPASASDTDMVETPEQHRARVAEALERNNGNKAATGRELGISAERVRQLATPKSPKGNANEVTNTAHNPFAKTPQQKPIKRR